MQREAASFLNVDLELNSPVSLAKLAKHFKGSAYVLFCGRTEGSYHLCAEALIRGHLSNNPRTCTTHLLDLLENLPAPLAALFERCSSREFDYGFDGGLESKPFSVTLAPTSLARMAALGIRMRVTVYPSLEENRSL
jgi:hypothetical protein